MQARCSRRAVSIWDSALKPRFEETREVNYHSSSDKVTLRAAELAWWDSEASTTTISLCPVPPSHHKPARENVCSSHSPVGEIL